MTMAGTAPPIRVAFVDDHEILVEGMVGIFGAKDDLDVVGAGHSAADAIRIVKQKQPDVVVLDLSMPGDTVAAIGNIVSNFPATKIVVFTASTSRSFAANLLEAGVAAYVQKGGTTSELHEAIRLANGGDRYVAAPFSH
jgi:DNA-binding NarL/FixJ family response regulator